MEIRELAPMFFEEEQKAGRTWRVAKIDSEDRWIPYLNHVNEGINPFHESVIESLSRHQLPPKLSGVNSLGDFKYEIIKYIRDVVQKEKVA